MSRDDRSAVQAPLTRIPFSGLDLGKHDQVVKTQRILNAEFVEETPEQEDQPASLGLVLNAVVLWTTRYLDAAVAQLEADGHVIDDADKAGLSPQKDKHVNPARTRPAPAARPGYRAGHGQRFLSKGP
ncbi:Tn3 family transposase [Amycolatopsis taiwanensis]|uniref:Tn3 family transposase n=1 Tax=Amycolatopsis taiwanensis TaxID=342230 RepID=UPI003CCB7F92